MVSDVRWQGYSHQQLHTWAQGGAGSAVHHGAAAELRTGVAELLAVDGELKQALAGMGTAWTGPAADSARSGLTPLGQWVADTATALSNARFAHDDHASAVAAVRTAMPEPAPEGRVPEVGPLLEDWSVEEARQRNAQMRAVELMTAYSDAVPGRMEYLTGTAEPPVVTVAGAPATALGDAGGTGPRSTPGGVGPAGVAGAGPEGAGVAGVPAAAAVGAGSWGTGGTGGGRGAPRGPGSAGSAGFNTGGTPGGGTGRAATSAAASGARDGSPLAGGARGVGGGPSSTSAGGGRAGTGPYGPGQNGAGRYGAGQYGSGRAGSGSAGATPHGTDAHGGGRYGPGHSGAGGWGTGGWGSGASGSGGHGSGPGSAARPGAPGDPGSEASRPGARGAGAGEVAAGATRPGEPARPGPRSLGGHFYPPMAGMGGGMGPTTRTRPGYLLDDSGAFDVDVPCTPPVIGEE